MAKVLIFSRSHFSASRFLSPPAQFPSRFPTPPTQFPTKKLSEEPNVPKRQEEKNELFSGFEPEHLVRAIRYNSHPL